MYRYDTIEFEVKDGIGTLWLNRPEVRNAFNNHMISDIIDCLETAEHDPEIMALVIRGRGKVFCAGADVNWMKSFSKLSYDEDYKENMHLARCFYMIYTFNKPTVAVAHGASFGGGNGLLAACDISFCDPDTVFSFSEVKIGIIPATISPYIIKRTGEFNARELMLTGKRFNGHEAHAKGLVNQLKMKSEIEEAVENTLAELKTSSPQAIASCKDLIFNVTRSSGFNEIIDYTAV
ncbi:MAG: enoyl-CoA hydratase-related protein [Cyclobacteriaceae bacterium]